MKATQKKLQKKPGKYSKDPCKHRCIKTIDEGCYEVSGPGSGAFDFYPKVVWCKSCGALGQVSPNNVSKMNWTMPSNSKK